MPNLGAASRREATATSKLKTQFDELDKIIGFNPASCKPIWIFFALRRGRGLCLNKRFIPLPSIPTKGAQSGLEWGVMAARYSAH